jgi:hypothetical protein
MMLKKMRIKFISSKHLQKKAQRKEIEKLKRVSKRGLEQESQQEHSGGSRSHDEPVSPRRLPNGSESTSVSEPQAASGASQSAPSKKTVNVHSVRASPSTFSEPSSIIDLTTSSQPDETSSAPGSPKTSPEECSDIPPTKSRRSHRLPASEPPRKKARLDEEHSSAHTHPTDRNPVPSTADSRVNNALHNEATPSKDLEKVLRVLLESYDLGQAGLQDVESLTAILNSAFHVRNTKELQSYFGHFWSRARHSNLGFKEALRAVVTFRERTGYTGKSKNYAGYVRWLSTDEKRSEARDEREILRTEIKRIIAFLEDGEDDYLDVAVDMTHVVIKLTQNKRIWGSTAQRLQLLCDDLFSWAEDEDSG